MRKNSVEAGCSLRCFLLFLRAQTAKSGYLSEQVQLVVSMKNRHICRDAIMVAVRIPCDVVKNMNPAREARRFRPRAEWSELLQRAGTSRRRSFNRSVC